MLFKIQSDGLTLTAFSAQERWQERWVACFGLSCHRSCSDVDIYNVYDARRAAYTFSVRRSVSLLNKLSAYRRRVAQGKWLQTPHRRDFHLEAMPRENSLAKTSAVYPSLLQYSTLLKLDVIAKTCSTPSNGLEWISAHTSKHTR